MWPTAEELPGACAGTVEEIARNVNFVEKFLILMDKNNFLGEKHVLLASASPRRRELLSQLNVEVVQAPLKKVDENYPASLDVEEVAAFISRKKAHAYLGELGPDDILVTADTVVINRGEVMGKPADAREAEQMLRRLSGRTHKVITGVTVATDRTQTTFSEMTEVEFAELTDEEIAFYVENYRPLDKAGAYGIQEWIGYIGVTGIRGDYYNVMGLPLHALYRTLKKLVRR